MARKNLLTPEMIGLSAALLDPERYRPVLTGTPLLAGFVPELEGAHDALTSLSPTSANDVTPAQELTALQQEARETDVTHDAKGGGVQGVLDGLIRLADTDEESARLAAVKDALFPDGGAIFTGTYIAEAGNAERVEKVLERKDVKDALRAIPVRKGVTLYDEARAFVKAGRRLGVLESRKAALAAAAKPAEEAPRGSTVAARNEWLQVMELITRSAKRLKGAQAEAWAPVARDIALVEAKGDERAARNKAAGKATDEDADPAEPDEDAKDQPLAPTG